MSDYKPTSHMMDQNTSEKVERIGDERNNLPIARDEMTEDSFNHMMRTVYQQALEDDSFSLDEVFDQIEERPTAIGGMSREELDAELAAGIASLKSGKTLSAEEFDAELAKEFDK